MEKSIVCYGDSNTYGYRSSGVRHLIRYPIVIQHELEAVARVYEEGLSGRTSIYSDPKEKERKGIDFVDDVFSKYDHIDLLIFMLGTNDLKINNARTEDEYYNGLDTILEKITKGYKINQLLLVSPIHIEKNVAYTDFDETSRELSFKSLMVYERLASKYHAYLLDASKYCVAGMDGLHMNLDNQVALGKAIVSFIKEKDI